MTEIKPILNPDFPERITAKWARINYFPPSTDKRIELLSSFDRLISELASLRVQIFDIDSSQSCPAELKGDIRVDAVEAADSCFEMPDEVSFDEDFSGGINDTLSALRERLSNLKFMPCSLEAKREELIGDLRSIHTLIFEEILVDIKDPQITIRSNEEDSGARYWLTEKERTHSVQIDSSVIKKLSEFKKGRTFKTSSGFPDRNQLNWLNTQKYCNAFIPLRNGDHFFILNLCISKGGLLKALFYSSPILGKIDASIYRRDNRTKGGDQDPLITEMDHTEAAAGTPHEGILSRLFRRLNKR